MELPSQEPITILALDQHQHPVFGVQFLGGGFTPTLLDEAMAFGLHLLTREPQVVRVGVYDRPADTLSAEKPLVSITRDTLPPTLEPVSPDQQPSRPPPRWARALLRLILESSFRC
jgi:hypothetical protein